MIKSTFIEDKGFNGLEVDAIRTGTSVEALRQAFAENLFYIQGKHPARATLHDVYMAVGLQYPRSDHAPLCQYDGRVT